MKQFLTRITQPWIDRSEVARLNGIPMSNEVFETVPLSFFLIHMGEKVFHFSLYRGWKRYKVFVPHAFD